MAFYTCDACKFSFERIGPVSECPDCGKSRIREATIKEKAAVLRYLAETALDTDCSAEPSS